VLKKPFDIGAAERVMLHAAERPRVLVVAEDPSVAQALVEKLAASGVHAEDPFLRS
jgi:hypothetical protein